VILGESQDPEKTHVAEVLPDKILLAKEYIRRSSLWFDFQLIFRTVCRMAD
jgi:lipopolysaccharide/colanic/teichoic acid biosynthesis glycosyltransferase